ncbi:MAG: 5'-nucleotidase C-terminal domain-containing protein, partial [Gemmatimonadota bacterium]
SLLPVTADVPRDPEVEALLAGYAPALNEVVGTLGSPLTATREGPSPLGDLAAEAIRSVTGTDVSVMPRGAVWSTLDAGPVTAADICRIHWQRVPVLTARVKGTTIGGLGRTPDALFSGCDVEDSTVVRINGVPVDTAAYYTLSAPISAFIRIESLRDLSVSHTGYRVDTAIERYLRLKGSVQPN